MTSHVLPIIDLRLLGQGNAMKLAAQNYGAFYVIGHGVPAKVQQQLLDYGRNSMVTEKRQALDATDDPLAEQYSAAMQAAGERVAAILALALGLQADALQPYLSEQRMELALRRCMPLHIANDGFDPAFFSIISTDAGEGVEVEVGGHWVDAPALPGALLVVLGAAAGRATGERFRTSRLRIVNWSGDIRMALPASFHFNSSPDSYPAAADAGAPDVALGALPRRVSTATAVASLLPRRRSSQCGLRSSASWLARQGGSQKQLAA